MTEPSVETKEGRAEMRVLLIAKFAEVLQDAYRPQVGDLTVDALAARLADAAIDARDKQLAEARALVAQQAEDDGLWFIARTAPEAYLQQELRRLHAAIEE